MFNNLKKKKYSSKNRKQIELKVYIVRGNNQIIKHYVNVSKKFIFEGHTYIIKRNCIFNEKEFGLLTPCIIFTEGNPNPHEFKVADQDIKFEEYMPVIDECEQDELKEVKKFFDKHKDDVIVKKDDMIPNLGLTPKELSETYGEDLYEILVRIQSENKMFFLFMFSVITLSCTVLILLGVIFGVVL